MTLPPDEAYRLAHESGVVVERPGRGLVRLTGPQRVWFLQNTITNDMEQAPAGSWVESCFLDLKGKVLAHFRVGVGAEALWLDVDPPGTADLVDWFVRYRFRTKVEIEDLSDAMRCFTVLGPPAHVTMVSGTFGERDGQLAFGGVLGGLAAGAWFASEPPAEIAGLPRADVDLYETIRVEAGIGRFGVDYGRDTLPQEAGLTSIVSVTKGCYVGQEVMARLHFRGHVNRALRRLVVEGAPPEVLPGRALLRNGETMGRVTSAARSPRLGTVAIGMVRMEVEPGERLEVEAGGVAEAGPVPEGTKVVRTSPRSPTPGDGR